LIEQVGDCSTRVFGLLPIERLERQLGSTDLTVVARATALFDASAVQWLLANPGTILADDSGRPLAIAVEKAATVEARAAIAGDKTRIPDHPLKPCATTYHSLDEPLRLAGGLACFTVVKWRLSSATSWLSAPPASTLAT
jgi:hypothetical protein